MDLSSLSDQDLQALYQSRQQSPVPAPLADLSKMSDAELQAAYAAKNPDVATDVAKTVGVAPVKVATGLAGLPGDARSLMEGAGDWIGNKLYGPATPEQQATLDRLKAGRNFGALPTGDTLRKGVESVTGPLYEPKTTAGKYADTGTQFALNALAAPQKSVAGAIGNTVKYGVVPGLASEAAGQATEGTAAEPYARIGTALAAGVGTGLAADKIARRSLAKQIPTSEEIGTAMTAGYNHPEVKALQIKPQAAEQLSTDINGKLLTQGIDDITAPQTTKIIERLKTPRFGPATTIEDLDGARKALSNVAPAEMRAAAIARGEIDNFLGGGLKQADVLAGDVAKANPILLEARGNAAANFRSQSVSKALNNAEINTASSYSGGNIDNATRQQLKPILKKLSNKGQGQNGLFSGYTPEEMSSLNTAVRGSTWGNLMRGVGKMGPNGGLMGGLHLGSAITTGGATLPLSALGFVAKKLGDLSTKQKAGALDELLRSRSPLAQRLATLTPQGTFLPSGGILASLGRQPQALLPFASAVGAQARR